MTRRALRPSRLGWWRSARPSLPTPFTPGISSRTYHPRAQRRGHACFPSCIHAAARDTPPVIAPPTSPAPPSPFPAPTESAPEPSSTARGAPRPAGLDHLSSDLLDGLEIAQVARNHDLTLLALLELLARPEVAARLAALRDAAHLRLELMALDARATAIAALKRLCFSPSDDIARRAASSLLRAAAAPLPPSGVSSPDRSPPEKPHPRPCPTADAESPPAPAVPGATPADPPSCAHAPEPPTNRGHEAVADSPAPSDVSFVSPCACRCSRVTRGSSDSAVPHPLRPPGPAPARSAAPGPARAPRAP